MYQITAIFPNGLAKVYTIENLSSKRFKKIITISELEDIYLKIYKVKQGEKRIIYDSIFFQMLAGVKNEMVN